MPMSPDQMNDLSSELIQNALEGESRMVAGIRTQSQALTSQLIEVWRRANYPLIPASLRLAGSLACIPSLVTVANSRVHTQATATEVTDNFQTLSSSVLDTRCLGRKALCRLPPEDRTRPRIAGQLSEMGILGVLWWSIANGLREEGTYALPTTRVEDEGEVRDGYHTGTDIIVYEGIGDERHKVQVKTSPPQDTDKNSYYPGITVVAVTNLVDSKGKHLKGPRSLLDFLTSGNGDDLTTINDQLDERFERAKDRANRHQQRQASRNHGNHTWRDTLDMLRTRL